MDRWYWSDHASFSSVKVISSFVGVSLYDGEVKTKFSDGELRVADSHLFWIRDGKILCMSLSLVVLVEELVEGSLLSKKHFVILHLNAPPPDKMPGPFSYSQFHQVRLRVKASQDASSVRSHVQSKLAAIQSKPQTAQVLAAKPTSNSPASGYLRGGLIRIEQDLQQRDAAASRDISDAFQDFQRLMARAGEMVDLAKTIAEKVKRQSQVSAEQSKDTLTADELVEFRSDLLALGFGAVTKEDCSSESGFHAQLAAEICRLLEPIIRKSGGGLMSLTDAYCRINRARGLSLVSPDDVLSAAKFMEKLNLPLRLHQFSTGVRCLRLAEVESRRLCLDTTAIVQKQNTGCSIDTFSVILSLPVAVARERLLAAESDGFLCRDETASGLFFYPNKFLEESILAL